MSIEQLESRRLLNGALIAKITHSGVFQITGSSQADVFAIEVADGRLKSSSLSAGPSLGTKVKRVRIDLNGGNDKLTIKSDVGTFVDGGAGRDKIIIDARGATVLGGSGEDNLQSIASLFPADKAEALMKRDERVSDPREFDVFSGTGNTLEGGPGNDRLYTRGGEDLVDGGSGFDEFIGLSDDITIYHSRTFPLFRAAVVTTWPSNAMVVQVEQSTLLEAKRSVRAYF